MSEIQQTDQKFKAWLEFVPLINSLHIKCFNWAAISWKFDLSFLTEKKKWQNHLWVCCSFILILHAENVNAVLAFLYLWNIHHSQQVPQRLDFFLYYHNMHFTSKHTWNSQHLQTKLVLPKKKKGKRKEFFFKLALPFRCL